jgi:hypothetical protein
MYGRKEKTYAKIEVFLLRAESPDAPLGVRWSGEKIVWATALFRYWRCVGSRGCWHYFPCRTIRFLFDGSDDEPKKLHALGETPIPNTSSANLNLSTLSDIKPFSPARRSGGCSNFRHTKSNY